MYFISIWLQQDYPIQINVIKSVKGILHPNFCHNLLTLKLLQTCMSLFLLLNTKEYILKNDWNQMV